MGVLIVLPAKSYVQKRINEQNNSIVDNGGVFYFDYPGNLFFTRKETNKKYR